MTSKYEDALDDLNKLKKIPSLFNDEVPQQCKVWFDRHIDLLDEALRKAESMDRLIEARKVATEGDWVCGTHPANHRLNIIRPIFFGNRVTKLPECEGGHVSLKNKSDAIFIATAANETAKYIED